MNKLANDLFRSNEQFRQQISKLAASQYSRRKKAYNTIAIFEVEDLEQEIWCQLFESDCIDSTDMVCVAESCAEKVAQRGIWKMNKDYVAEVPVSQLDNERRYVENLLYSTVGADSVD